ncbi:MAG: ABC transporter permease [Alphaproteobacteria bacterium]|nr:ABC transporter permease [Alphaproteobacteria bacterium]
MPRSGSPWTGLAVVYFKELADHLGSARMRVLEWLVLLTGLAAVYTAIQDLRNLSAQDPFLFLRLFTLSREPLPSFVALLGFLIPLVSIGLGFDTINSEFSRRTMSRVLAQPIYRDALLFGKFLAGLSTLGLSLLALWLLIVGIGLVMLGVPPSGEEVLRGLAFLIAALAYAGVWLAAAMLFSVIFRSAATSALCAIGLWLLFSLIWPILAPFFAQIISPSESMIYFGIPSLEQILWQQNLARLSPSTLFGESILAILQPTTRTLGLVLPSQVQGAIGGTPLSFEQSLLLVWPQMTGLVAAAIILFAASYVVFQRQEVRA